MYDKKKIRNTFPIGCHHYEMSLKDDYCIDKWNGPDSKENFLDISKFMDKWGYAPNWKWRSNTINYYRSKNGLRLNFYIDDEYDFSGKQVVLGCSFVEGIGCGEDETISAWMTKLSGKTTLNFGNGGTGCDVVFYNAMWLASLKNPPEKIFILWPQIQRFSFFDTEYNIVSNKSSARDNSKVLDSFLYTEKRRFGKYYKSQIMANPVVQAGNKSLWLDLIRTTWGSRVVELDILDSSEYNKTYNDDAKNEILNIEYRRTLPKEEILDGYCGRDIGRDTLERLFQNNGNTGGFCHWGSLYHRDIASWFLAQ